jgi:LPXTG-motif cell wall-anchored protein
MTNKLSIIFLAILFVFIAPGHSRGQHRCYVRFGNTPDGKGSGIYSLLPQYSNGYVPVLLYSKKDVSHHTVSVDMDIEMATLYSAQIDQFTNFASGTYTFANFGGVEIPAEMLGTVSPVVIPYNYTIKVPSFSTCPVTPPAANPFYVKIHLGNFANGSQVASNGEISTLHNTISSKKERSYEHHKYAGNSNRTWHAKHKKHHKDTRYVKHNHSRNKRHEKHEDVAVADSAKKEQPALVKADDSTSKKISSDTAKGRVAAASEHIAATDTMPVKQTKTGGAVATKADDDQMGSFIGLGGALLLMGFLVFLIRKRKNKEALPLHHERKKESADQALRPDENYDQYTKKTVKQKDRDDDRPNHPKPIADADMGYEKYKPRVREEEKLVSEISAIAGPVIFDERTIKEHRPKAEEITEEVVEERTVYSERQTWYLEEIAKSSTVLLYLTGGIRSNENAGAGEIKREYVDFSLLSAMQHLLRTLRRSAKETGVQMNLEMEADVEDVVVGDPVMLTQLLFTLADNAIKYTEKGSVTIKITKADQDSAIRFSIIETGKEIPQNRLLEVFEHYHAEKRASDLAMGHHRVEIMNGNVCMESKRGSGNIFSFVVRLEKGAVSRLNQWIAMDEQADAGILDNIHLLIVDGNEYFRTAAEEMLQSKSKIRIDTVSNANEASNLLKNIRFDVMIIDTQLPGMNGFEFTRYLREHAELPYSQIPVIALENPIRPFADRHFRDAGINAWFNKSFIFSEYLVAITRVLKIGRTEETTATQSGSQYNEREYNNDNVLCYECDADRYLNR